MDKYNTYKLSYESDFDGKSQEIIIRSKYMDGISFTDLLNGFRQFIIALSYSEDVAKSIVSISKEEEELLGYGQDELQIVKYEE